MSYFQSLHPDSSNESKSGSSGSESNGSLRFPLRASPHLPSPTALNGWRPSCWDWSLTLPLLMIFFLQNLFSTAGPLPLAMAPFFLTCLPFFLHRRASKEKVFSVFRAIHCCRTRCRFLPEIAAISTCTNLSLLSSAITFFCGELRTTIF